MATTLPLLYNGPAQVGWHRAALRPEPTNQLAPRSGPKWLAVPVNNIDRARPPRDNLASLVAMSDTPTMNIVLAVSVAQKRHMQEIGLVLATVVRLRSSSPGYSDCGR